MAKNIKNIDEGKFINVLEQSGNKTNHAFKRIKNIFRNARSKLFRELETVSSKHDCVMFSEHENYSVTSQNLQIILLKVLYLRYTDSRIPKLAIKIDVGD